MYDEERQIARCSKGLFGGGGIHRPVIRN